MTPKRDTRPYVGFRPTTPDSAAGWRIEPPVAVPRVPNASRAATAAALPPDEAREQRLGELDAGHLLRRQRVGGFFEREFVQLHGETLSLRGGDRRALSADYSMILGTATPSPTHCGAFFRTSSRDRLARSS